MFRLLKVWWFTFDTVAFLRPHGRAVGVELRPALHATAMQASLLEHVFWPGR